MKPIIAYVGVPARILSDHGTKFTVIIWRELQELLGCSLIHTSPYHPQGNAIVERVHRTMNNLLRSSLANSLHNNWVDLLPSIQLSINSAVQDTQSTPHFLCYTVQAPPTAACRQSSATTLTARDAAPT